MQEINRKIDTVCSTMAASSQGCRATVRDVQNPSVDLLNQQLATARIVERKADGNIIKTSGQLVSAKAWRDELLAAGPQVLELQGEQEGLHSAYHQLGPVSPHSGVLDIGELETPYLSAIDRKAALLYAWGDLILGTVLMAAARLMQRAVFRQLLPTDHVTVRPFAIQTQLPSLIDTFGKPAPAAIQQKSFIRHAQ